MKTIGLMSYKSLQQVRRKKNNFIAKKIVLLLLMVMIKFSGFSQLYVGNSPTGKGVTITPGYLLTNNIFFEGEAVLRGTDNFVFGKYSLFAGKQFLIKDFTGDEDKCVKVKMSVGATVTKSQTILTEIIYNDNASNYKVYDNVCNSNQMNINYRVELVWHNKPFDYFILAGYNNGMYSGIGWRGFFKKK
ncbi:MAG: hypothetical protein LH615_15675 [Ferruginibacter sp.]|nr:hypothetical protein [Ferruginibacter sp.]